VNFIVSHPTGNTFVRALLSELHDKNLLQHFYTTIGFGNQSNFIFSNFKKRRGYNIPDSKIKRIWFHELIRLISTSNQLEGRRKTDHIYLNLDNRVAKEICVNTPNIVHTYEDCAYKTFKKAKELGVECSYELPIAHWLTTRSLLAIEAERYPHWEPTLESTREPEEKLCRKDEELILADKIFCPSQFVLESIPKKIRSNTPCKIVPFGSPPAAKPDCLQEYPKSHFRIIFVGSMSQRKGLADLLVAMKTLSKHRVQLSILGQPSMPMEFYRNEFSEFQYYPPCSNRRVRQIMQLHDALILPSLVEGRALVQQEALSCGIPIIVTKNAGGEDLIEEGITGHIIPIQSPDKIIEKVLSLRNSTYSKLDIFNYCTTKAKNYTWESYAKSIIN
jgi:glycosyltransferase involved in cell wall biosynthesis